LALVKSRSDLPVEISDIVKEESWKKTVARKKLLDLIDASHTVAMRLTTKAPRLTALFMHPNPVSPSPSSVSSPSKIHSKDEEETTTTEESSQKSDIDIIDAEPSPHLQMNPDPPVIQHTPHKQSISGSGGVQDVLDDESIQIPFQDLQFETGGLLGSGSFGRVYKVNFFVYI
jgi:hypothetical protein